MWMVFYCFVLFFHELLVVWCKNFTDFTVALDEANVAVEAWNENKERRDLKLRNMSDRKPAPYQKIKVCWTCGSIAQVQSTSLWRFCVKSADYKRMFCCFCEFSLYRWWFCYVHCSQTVTCSSLDKDCTWWTILNMYFSIIISWDASQ